jgi:hypothetical protein
VVGAEPQQVPGRLERFRADYRSELTPNYNGWRHMLLNSAGVTGMGLLCLTGLDAPSAWHLLAIPSTLMACNIAEFFFHKVPMHRPIAGLKAMFQRHVGVHHRYFTHERMSGSDAVDFHATLTAPVQLLVVFLVAGLPMWLATRFLLGPNEAALLGATAAGYTVVFEWLHLAWHARESHWVYRVPGMRALRRHHQLHHDPKRMNHEAFNISFPLTDHLFGTTPE